MLPYPEQIAAPAAKQSDVDSLPVSVPPPKTEPFHLPPLPPIPEPAHGFDRGMWESPATESRIPNAPSRQPLAPPPVQPLPQLKGLGQRDPLQQSFLPPAFPPPQTAGATSLERERKGPAGLLSQYALRANDDGPRALRWEEARVGFVPLGCTLRGVVEEVRPYGAFIGLVVNATSRFL